MMGKPITPCRKGAISAIEATSSMPQTNMKARPTTKLRSLKMAKETKGCGVVREWAKKK